MAKGAKFDRKRSREKALTTVWPRAQLKKDYLAGVGDSFDLVVIGADFGAGKRTGVYGAFHLACFDEETQTYQAICKIGTGFSDEALKSHHERLQKGKKREEGQDEEEDEDRTVGELTKKPSDVDMGSVAPANLPGQSLRVRIDSNALLISCRLFLQTFISTPRRPWSGKCSLPTSVSVRSTLRLPEGCVLPSHIHVPRTDGYCITVRPRAWHLAAFPALHQDSRRQES